MARNFKKITARQHTFENEGDSVEGTLVNREVVHFENEGKDTPVGKYTLETDEGERISFLGSAMLDSSMGTVELGQYVRVTYTGSVARKSGSGHVKTFDVEVAAD